MSHAATLTLPAGRFAAPQAPAGGPPRLRVLVSAYAVSPARGSEPGMGWNICTRLARHHDVTVLCSPSVPPDAQDFRGEIDAYTHDQGPVPGLSFHFVEPPLASYLLQRETPLMRRTFYYAGYAAWQRAALRAARTLHAQRPFDVVHQLNITGFREPGYLWKLPGVPFVWGPIGGAANIPSPFLGLMSARERLFYRLRNVANAWQKRTARRCRRAAARASHLWVVGEANRQLVEDVWGRTAEPILEVGGESHGQGVPRSYDGSRPLRLVWSGQHIGRKALPLLLRAIASLNGRLGAQLTVLGDGPECAGWRSLADQLGIGALVRWTGRVPRDEALRAMAGADAFCSTSVLEETSLVVLEALSLGLPVLCHDACGMSVAVNETCGIKVPMRDPAASVEGFARAIERLSEQPTELRRLSAGALRRASELSWDSKAEHMARTYSRVALGVATGNGGTR